MSAVDLNRETIVKSADHVMFRELGEESILLNLETGVYFGLNETGTRVWSLLDGAANLQKLHSRLSAEFDVEPDVLWEDLLALIAEMSRRGLIREARPE